MVEPLHKAVYSFKKKADKVANRPCSAMLKFSLYMDLIYELKTKTLVKNRLSLNDLDVILALANKGMRAL